MTHLELLLSGMLVLQAIYVVLLTTELNEYHKIMVRYSGIIDDLLSRKDRPHD